MICCKQTDFGCRAMSRFSTVMNSAFSTVMNSAFNCNSTILSHKLQFKCRIKFPTLKIYK